MSDLTIKTNHQYRDTLTWFELSDKERREFDYLDTDEKQDETTFIRYRGWVYDISDFMRVDGMPGFNGWDGYRGDSFYSGVLIKLDPDGDRVLVATYVS